MCAFIIFVHVKYIRYQSMAKPGNSLYAIIAMLSSIIIITSLISVAMPSQERFSSDTNLTTLNDRVIVYQGTQVPTTPPTEVVLEQDPSMPPVDGNPESPKSLFMMAFNKCDPSCCPSTYSCSGGCVCMTDEQKNFIGNRGHNSANRCKLKDNTEY